MIGDMSLVLQGKVLRALQEWEIERPGSAKRCIAALIKAAESGQAQNVVCQRALDVRHHSRMNPPMHLAQGCEAEAQEQWDEADKFVVFTEDAAVEACRAC
jgi:transcriptional regulator with PAS, ATPase and Fis domain